MLIQTSESITFLLGYTTVKVLKDKKGATNNKQITQHN